MELMSGYKQTEIGVMPEEWQTPKVGEICGCIVPGRNKPKLFNGDIPWITTPDLENGKSVTTSRLDLFISREEAKSVGSKVVPIGSVLLSCAGELGIVALTSNEIVVNQQLHVFIPSDRVEATFLLNALAFRKEQIENYGTKTAVPYLNKDACNSILVPLPSISEQRAIATALSDMDALLEGLDQLIAKKRDLKQATMQQLLTGKTRLPGFCAGTCLSGDAMDGKELIEGEWEVKRLGDVFHFQNGTALEKFFNYHDGLEVVSIGNYSPSGKFVKTGTFISHNLRNEVEKFVLKKNELAMILNDKTAVGSIIGRVLLIDKDNHYVFNQRTMRLSCKKDIVPLFAYHLINSDMVHKKIVLAAKPGTQIYINTDDVLTLELTLPSTEEQTAIATILSDMDTEIEALQQRRSKTRDLKQAMMQELLTGKTRLISNREK